MNKDDLIISLLRLKVLSVNRRAGCTSIACTVWVTSMREPQCSPAEQQHSIQGNRSGSAMPTVPSLP